MRTIWKFEIRIIEKQLLLIPDGFKILCCDLQNNVYCIWAEVESSNPLQEVEIFIVGTGHFLPNNLTYINTIQLNAGNLVFHVYYKDSEELTT